jgi:hypothetical protein
MSAPLLRLPLEMLTNITDRLALHDKVHLAMTNRYLRSMIKPPTQGEFLQVENSEWAISRQLYSCKGCAGFRPLLHFADDMRKGRRARRGAEAGTRLCIKCGVDCGWYAAGTEISVLGRRAVLGQHCRALTDHTRAKASCGSVGALWTLVRTGEPRWYHSNNQLPEDDWAHSTRYFGQGRHAEEVFGCWLDL